MIQEGSSLLVRHHGGWRDHQVQPATELGLGPQQQGDALHGLTETHVVGQDAAGAQVVQEDEPRKAVLLVGTQVGAQGARLGDALDLTDIFELARNRPHGTLFDFLRNDKLDARNFFVAQKAKLRRNQFGGTLSGPVWIPKLYNGRDRTFFLASWESYRQISGVTRLGRVPTELERQGDFSRNFDVYGNPIPLHDPFMSGNCTATVRTACFPGNKIPADRINPVSGKLMEFYPLPNRADAANNFIVTANQPGAWNSFVFKVDHHLSSKDSLSVRALDRFDHGTMVFKGSTIPGFGSTSEQLGALYGLNYTRMFAPTMVNELRASASRTRYAEAGAHAGQDWQTRLGMPATTTDPKRMGFAAFTINNLLPLGDAAPNRYASTNYQLGDTATWVTGRHMLKFGGDILHTQFYQPVAGSALGSYQFLDRWTNIGFGDFLLGLLNYVNLSVLQSPSYLISRSYGAFVQDDIKAGPRLTFNFGLRYELLKPTQDKYGRLSNFMPEYGKIVVADDRTVPNLEELVNATGLKGMVALARDYGLSKSLTHTQHKNFAPRFGFAWRPFGGQRTAVRGGYGIFYGGTQMDPIRQQLTSMYPFQIGTTYQRLTSNPLALTVQNPFPANRMVLYGVSNAAGYELRPGPQYLQSWNLTVEREMGRGSAIEVAYAGSKGTHLSRMYDLNQPFYNPQTKGSLRPYAGITTINYFSFGSNSSYNAGMLTIRKRFAHGLFYRANYVYSKSIDNASQVSGKSSGGYRDAQNARNLRSERGRSDWDTGHALTVSFSYELPLGRSRWWRGWELTGSGRMYTGKPFTPQVSGADLNNGEANRPDRIAKGRLDQRTPERWFDVFAFREVPLGAYRYGNSGRNIVDGPGSVALNLGVSKRFQIRERDYLQLRCESFNATNHTNFRIPNVNVNAPDGSTITGASPARQMQVALKYQF